MVGLLLALGHQLLARGVDEVAALAVPGAPLDLVQHAIGHVVDPVDDVHATGGPHGQLVGTAGRRVAVAVAIVLGRGEELQIALHAVVVCGDQPVGRHEGAATAVQQDDRTQRGAEGIGEGLGVEVQAAVGPVYGDGGELLGEPHAFFGEGGEGQQQGEEE